MRMVRLFGAAFMAAVLGAGLSPAYADSHGSEGDPAKGAKVYRKCKACHELTKERNKVGPHLVKIFNRPVAAVEGFRYSKALKKAGEEGMVWNAENLDKWLENPKKFLPGNRMAFAGLKKEADRKNLIAYMKKEGGVWGE